MKKFLLLLFSLFCLSGCLSTRPFRPLHIGGLVFQNLARSPIENIVLSVENTREFASCSRILPGSSFSTRFPTRRYQGNPAVVSWEQNRRSWTSEPMVLNPPDGPDNGKTFEVLIVFFDDGRIHPQLVQAGNP